MILGQVAQDLGINAHRLCDGVRDVATFLKGQVTGRSVNELLDVVQLVPTVEPLELRIECTANGWPSGSD